MRAEAPSLCEEASALIVRTRGLNAVWYPDVLDLRGVRQHRAAASLRRTIPVASLGAADPGALERAGRQALDFGAAVGRAVVAPHRVNVRVRRQRARQFVRAAGDDVDHAVRQVRRIEHLIQVGGRERMRFRRHHHHAVASAMAGATSEMKPSSGASFGQTMPITPTGSFSATVMPCVGGWCTWPSYLSAQAA